MSGILDHRAQELGYSSYEDYLRGDHWKGFSRRVRQRNCFCCAQQTWLTAVHHITYERLGGELGDDVITACHECHQAIHDLCRTEGVPLAHAHFVWRKRHRQQDSAKVAFPNSPTIGGARIPIVSTWVSYEQLAGPIWSLGQVADWLGILGFRRHKKPTIKAYQQGLVRDHEGCQLWHWELFLETTEKIRHRFERRQQNEPSQASPGRRVKNRQKKQEAFAAIEQKRRAGKKLAHHEVDLLVKQHQQLQRSKSHRIKGQPKWKKPIRHLNLMGTTWVYLHTFTEANIEIMQRLGYMTDQKAPTTKAFDERLVKSHRNLMVWHEPHCQKLLEEAKRQPIR